MSDSKKLVDGATINDLMTAYLHGLHAYRGGRMSPADAMHHMLDVMDGAQRAKSRIDRFLGGLLSLGQDKS